MGITAINLYRMGNANSPKMDDVRIGIPNQHIDAITDLSGLVWVVAGTGGVSTWDTPNPGLRGRTWLIPSGIAYSDRLRVWNDSPGHWLWEPVRDMLLADFQADLAAINAAARAL
jgi:hypothetical protein